MAAKKRKTKESEKTDLPEAAASELNEPRWSVVSFEKRVAENLIYAEAVAELERLRARKMSGLCVITDDAASRSAGKD